MFDLSRTGRKIRKDSFEYNHDMDKICVLLKELYVDKHLSTNDIPKAMIDDHNIEISSLKCYYLLKDLGLLRNKSESISLAKSQLDYSQKIINSELQDIIDGIVIGDGYIQPNHNTNVARVSIGGAHKEFIEYCCKLLSPFGASTPTFTHGVKGTGMWNTVTKHHPDLYVAYKRWYPNRIKSIPIDINLNKTTILLWYLGDGSISLSKENNSRSLYFATNCFDKNNIENILVPKLKDIGIETSRITNDKRLFITTSSIAKLLKIMGNESPVACYSYKFIIEEWRTKKTMKEVSIELNIDYQRLANWVKKGIVRHSRSPGGKKVVFSESELNELNRRIVSGNLSIDKGKWAHMGTGTNLSIDIVNSKCIKMKNETEDEFLDRIVKLYSEYGFPYRRWNNEKLLKEWYNLKKAQYIPPDGQEIKWRKEGMAFADYFHPHIFDINFQYKCSPMSIFSNKETFKKCLMSHIKNGGVLTFSGVHDALCRSLMSKRVNNFSPLVARDIYNYYCKDGFRVIDPCSGFSGRLTGASLCKYAIEYIGLDPCTKTFNGLIESKKFIYNTRPEFKCNIVNDCAENHMPNIIGNSFDFCFTSPPYFNLEHYSNEPSQSYIKYPSYDEWLTFFLEKMLIETYRILKPNSYAIINIGNANKHDIPNDFIEISKSIGFKIEQSKYIVFDRYGCNEKRLEPIFVLKKD